MKHDEKKIEEIKSRYPESAHIESLEPAFSSDLMEYAEHMVQQERERVIEIVKSVSGKLPTDKEIALVGSYQDYEFGVMDAKLDIINLINKE